MTTKIKGTEETNSIKQCSQQFFSPIAKDYFEWLQSMEGKGGEKNNGIMKGVPYSDSNSREQVILLLRLDLFNEGRYGSQGKSQQAMSSKLDVFQYNTVHQPCRTTSYWSPTHIFSQFLGKI